MKTLEQIEAENADLFAVAREWVMEGWGIRHVTPEPEQLAAAMFMEASDQDDCVKRGESSPEYPQQLREVAFQILFALHGDPTSPVAVDHLTVYHNEAYTDGNNFCVDVDRPDSPTGRIGGDDGFRFPTPEKAGVFVAEWLHEEVK